MKLRHILLALSLALALAGPPVAAPAVAQSPEAPQPKVRLPRADSDQNAGPCPLLGVLYDAHRVVEFNGPDDKYASVAYTGSMEGVRGLCRYKGDDPIKLNLEIDMAFGKGPAATSGKKTYYYWVAVTRSDIAPIEKKYFAIDVEFPRDSDRVTITREIDEVLIPRANEGVSGLNFEILVGFHLTPDQLAYNRSGRRFVANAANLSASQK